jgi:hypothetical protein
MDSKDFLNKIIQEEKALVGEGYKDKIFFSQNIFPSQSLAQHHFPRSIDKLLDVNKWSELSGLTCTFQVFDIYGKPVERKAQKDDFVKIILPGPFPENWVKIVDVSVQNQLAELTVSPCSNPNNPSEERVDHFFTKTSTNTIRVELEDATIRAYEIGVNEQINNRGEKAGDRKIINTIIAEGGWTFFQKIQWEKLTAYLVHLA